MEDFVVKFQSLSGCIDIIQNRETGDILSVVSGITEIPVEKLKDLEVNTLGTKSRKIPYYEVIKVLKKLSACFGQLKKALKDNLSRKVFFSILRYWLLPDTDFLKESFSEKEEAFPDALLFEDPGLSIMCPDEIKDHIDNIIDMRPGEYLKYEAVDVLSDIAAVYMLISALRDDLHFYLNMSDMQSVHLYVVSPLTKMERLKQKRERLKVVCLAKDPGEWRNEELLKDKGLVPYFLHRDFDCDSLMVGVDNGDYPYLRDYLQGMQMEFLSDGSPEKKCGWISEHAEDIDILIVNGLYPVNMDILRIYQEKNPCGLTYLPLDANSEWMDRIMHKDPFFSDMLENVDVIGSSGRKIQKLLNEKWMWPVEYFPNGFYHPWIKIDALNYDIKENVILTVGRLGTEQKATDVMLEAFAQAAGKIPGWKLRLVGSIESSFEKYIDDYYVRYPNLRERVEFKGKITGKNELFAEYQKAKVFTLTSILEGGCPNVIAEALHCGCAIATTEYDAFEDATDHGKCGMSAPIGDVKRMSELFITLCTDEDRLKRMCRHAFDYAEKNYQMDKIVFRINDSLSGAI